VGGKLAKVLYHGRSPQFPGLDQINLEIPADSVIGCYVPIAVRAGGVMSNFASISVIAGGNTCGDSVSFRGALLGAAGQHDPIRIGMVEMVHEQYSTPTSETVFWTEDAYRRFFAIQWKDLNLLPRLGDLQILPGACTVIVNKWGAPEDDENIYPNLPNPSVPLPSGPLRLRGPAGEKQLLDSGTSIGGMDEVGGPAAPRFLLMGEFTVEDLNPPEPPTRRSILSFPGEVLWSNKPSISMVDRGGDLTFQWTGGQNAAEYLVVGGSSADANLKTRVTFLCGARPDSGSFTVPPYVLSALPGNTPNTFESYPYGFLFLASTPLNTAPRMEQGSLDMFYFRYVFMDVSVVDFR
jgi:hypothetical protein